MSGASRGERLSINANERPGEVTLRLSGELDLVTAPVLRDELAGHQARGARIVLDLAGIEFLDSTGLVLLMEVAREPAETGWSLAIRRDLSPPVARLFQVTRTEGLFNWVD